MAARKWLRVQEQALLCFRTMTIVQMSKRTLSHAPNQKKFNRRGALPVATQ